MYCILGLIFLPLYLTIENTVLIQKSTKYVPVKMYFPDRIKK